MTPDLDDDAAFRRFMIDFVAFQAQGIEKSFRTSIDKLDRSWKQYVLKRAAALER